jgi:hypothetical protein
MVGEMTITGRAAEKIQALLAGTKEGNGLRVKVVEGGCSGFECKMDIDSPEAEDQVFEKNGAAGPEEHPSSERDGARLQERANAVGVRV